MKIVMECVEATFSPGQVERITGVATVKQRIWRHRGVLPAQSAARASFSAEELAGVVILTYLEITPGGDLKRLAAHAEAAAPCVLGLALADPNAWIVPTFSSYRNEFFQFLEETTKREGPSAIARMLRVVERGFGRFYVASLQDTRVTDDPLAIFDENYRAAGLLIDLKGMARMLVASVVKGSEDTPLFWVTDEKVKDDKGTKKSGSWKDIVLRNGRARS